MGKPTPQELEEALAEAVRMREHGEDPHHVAKALLNLNYRMKHLEQVAECADRYVHFGLAEHDHAALLRAIEAYKRVDAITEGTEAQEQEPGL
jgi:3-hydroxyisobutyrate dehydrogenase-like beta-hydroxyacid dehydrogenase